jgi:hypothetical protein
MNTEAWLMSLRKKLPEVEQDTEEAHPHRRELVKLLVENITADRDEDGRAKVDITYRFGPPEAPLEVDSLVGVQSSPKHRLANAHSAVEAADVEIGRRARFNGDNSLEGEGRKFAGMGLSAHNGGGCRTGVGKPEGGDQLCVSETAKSASATWIASSGR